MKLVANNVAVIEGDRWHAVWIEQCGKLIHDTWTVGNCVKHIQPGDVAVNVGAHIGTLVRGLLDAGAVVIAFEPNHEALECLVHNCPEAIRFGHAIGNSISRAELVRDPDNTGASFIRASETGDIQVRPLDFFALSPRLIVADCEGYEVQMLQGARETIERCKPVIICEVNAAALERAGNSRDELFSLLDEYGYQWRILQPECSQDHPQFDIESIAK